MRIVTGLLTVGLLFAGMVAQAVAPATVHPAQGDAALETTRWNIASHLYLLSWGPYDQAGTESNINYAADLGFNAIRFNIWWHEIYPDARSLRKGGNWYPLDHNIDYATRRGLKVIITLSLRGSDRAEELLSDDERVHDSGGAVDRNWDKTTRLSFSSPRFGRAIRFVQEVGERYAPYQNNGHILAIAPLVTREAEIPYAHDKLEDFSPVFLDEFRGWLLRRYGNDVANLNQAWDTRYKTFDDVKPPRDFDGVAGRDWYLFRDLKARQFVDSCCAALADIKGLTIPYRVLLDYGNVGDPMAWKRGSLSFVFHAANPMVWGVKHNDAHDYDQRYTGSLLGSNMKRMGKVAFNEWFHDRDKKRYPHREIVDDSYNEIKMHYDQGMNGVSYVGVQPGNADLEAIVARLKADGVWNAPVSGRDPEAPAVNVKFSTLLPLDGWALKKRHFDPHVSKTRSQVNLLIDYDLPAEPLLPVIGPLEHGE